MICPALSDPFHGQYYRVIAMGYFSFLLPLVGGLYSLLGNGVYFRSLVEKIYPLITSDLILIHFIKIKFNHIEHFLLGHSIKRASKQD